MKLLKTMQRDFLKVLPATVFFLIAFILILATKHMILLEYGISWTGFGAALIGAGLVGKVVLIVDKLPFANKFPGRPLIYNASWKSLIYFLAALLIRYLGEVVPLLAKHGSLAAAIRHSAHETVWPHFWLLQMWLAVLFFAFCTLRELARAIGKDRVIRMVFGGRNKTADLSAG